MESWAPPRWPKAQPPARPVPALLGTRLSCARLLATQSRRCGGGSLLLVQPRPHSLKGGRLFLHWLAIPWGCQEWRSFRAWGQVSPGPSLALSATLIGPQKGPHRLQEVLCLPQPWRPSSAHCLGVCPHCCLAQGLFFLCLNAPMTGSSLPLKAALSL